jgi:hypothetical protein
MSRGLLIVPSKPLNWALVEMPDRATCGSVVSVIWIEPESLVSSPAFSPQTTDTSRWNFFAS